LKKIEDLIKFNLDHQQEELPEGIIALLVGCSMLTETPERPRRSEPVAESFAGSSITSDI
jgi:hypothetical protein